MRSLNDPGAGRTQVSAHGGEEPRWHPSGTDLYYRTRAGEMMAAEVSLGTTFTAQPPRVLFVAPGMVTDNYHAAYAVSRDGRFLMIDQSAGDDNHLVLVFNWFEELRARERDRGGEPSRR